MCSDVSYQKDLSVSSPILLDYSHKRAKVEKLLAILEDAGCLKWSGGIALDVGCSAGFFAEGVAPYFKKVYGIDIDGHALQVARKNCTSGNVQILYGDSMNLPFSDASIDLIICNHVYEHVPDAGQMFTEIHRVLKVGGVCYLGAASRLTIVEPHYHLPFLSWLPKWIAHKYMRVFAKGDFYYENLRTYRGILSLIDRFEISDYTLKIVADPDRFACRDIIKKEGMLDRVPSVIWRLFYRVLPTYIFCLKKVS